MTTADVPTAGAPPRNIVLCSDGTGQAGTNWRGTNVWKVRLGVERHDYDHKTRGRQIVFYDNGVGTSAFSVTKILGSAFGYGLAANMKELYSSLARTYLPGDRLYVFGFSRGAFTARSLAGMISEVGVIDGRRDHEELEDLVERAYKAYRASPRKNPIDKFRAYCDDQGVRVYEPDIHFIGVWDTVAAYGMPIRELRDVIYGLIESMRRPHNAQLTDKMHHVYHAMAIDEDRLTFEPTLYDESKKRPPRTREDGTVEPGTNLEQVWFSGAHSNVGGGYPRQGLSDIALYWMMTKAEKHGLRFHDDVKHEARRDADVHSTLYDQRSGPGAIWRYQPRKIAALCEAAHCEPRVHVTVMDRIEIGTAGYSPVTLPADFEVVGTDEDDKRRVEHYNRVVHASAKERGKLAPKAWRQIRKRRNLYRAFLICTLLIVLMTGWLVLSPEGAIDRYREFSLFNRVGGAIGQASGLGDLAGRVWEWTEMAAVAFTPGLFKKVTAALFRLPEFIFLIGVIALVLVKIKKKRLAKIRHHGLNLWRTAFLTTN